MLQAVGISAFQEHVYRALLRAPAQPPSELGVAVQAGPDKIRKALLELERLGLVRRDRRRRFTPVAPDAALTALVHRRQAELNLVEATAVELTNDFRAAELQTDPTGLIEIVTGEDAIYRRSHEIFSGARAELCGFQRPPFLTETDEREIEIERPLLTRKVKVRSVYSLDALDIPGRFANVRRLVELGEEARTLPDLPVKLQIADRRIAILSLTTAHPIDSIMVIHQSGLLDALDALFERCWAIATPIDSPGSQRTHRIPPQEDEVLAMLGAGLKDQAIARQLGTSLRTTRRRIHQLISRLHAATRFQAGAVAARQGLLGNHQGAEPSR